MEHLWLYAVLVAGIVVLPGMDMAFVLASTLVDGRRSGAAAVAGIVLGGMVHVAMGALGVGLLLQHFPLAFNALLLAGSLTVTTYAVTASRGVVSGLPGGVRFLLDTVQFALLTGGIAALYRYVPNTRVRWSHALIGGIFVATGLEVAKKLLA
eukprot:gene22129-42362_t